MKNLNNITPSDIFGQTGGVQAYHRLVDEYLKLMDSRVEDIGAHALNEAMMTAGKTAQDIDRAIALSAILKTVDEQAIAGLKGNETG